MAEFSKLRVEFLSIYYLLMECIRTDPISVRLFAQVDFGTFNFEWFQSILSEPTNSAAKFYLIGWNILTLWTLFVLSFDIFSYILMGLNSWTCSHLDHSPWQKQLLPLLPNFARLLLGITDTESRVK